MWTYLIGVIATIAMMVLCHYLIKKDIYGNDIFAIIFISIFSWVGFIATIVLLLIICIICFCDNLGNKPIIKWKSRKKDT